MPRLRAWAGVACLLATVQYSVAEAIAAAAWVDPPYSYARNFISDLGVLGCDGQSGAVPVCSPLAWVMNTGFVVQGLLMAAASLLLAPLIERGAWRRAVVLFGLVHGFGTIVVGLAPATHDGFVVAGLRAHLIGAYLAIVAGNLAILAAGLAVRDEGAARWYVRTSVVLGAVGLAGGLILLGGHRTWPGLFERMAADTVTLWTVTTGLTLCVMLGHRRAPSPISAGHRSAA